MEYCCSLSLLLWLLGVTVPVPFDPRAGVEAISSLLQAQSFPDFVVDCSFSISDVVVDSCVACCILPTW
jgi:hypothetical protein